ncbi:GNAT family N-acetyltransferase [Micromonospora zhanjiangensis]
MEPVEIIHGDLLLRPWRSGDADAVHRACQDPAIQRWTSVPSPYLPEHATGFVTGIAPAAWAAGTGAPFAVCDAGTGELLGSCGLVSIDRALDSAEVGYWTAPWARGRGVAVRATRAVARWAFDQLGMRRIVWQAEVGNHASRLVALRAGFRIDGRLRLAHPHPMGGPDGWIGSLLPADLPTPPDAPATPTEHPVDDGGPASPTGRPATPADDGAVVLDPLEVRRAAVFGRDQPVLFATTVDGEIRLRRPEDRDIDDLVVGCRDPESIRWTSVPDPYQRGDAEFYVRELAVDTWARGTGAIFAVADPEDRYAGTLDLRISPSTRPSRTSGS